MQDLDHQQYLTCKAEALATYVVGRIQGCGVCQAKPGFFFIRLPRFQSLWLRESS